MPQLLSDELDIAKNHLQELVKPFQQEQNQRQKKFDFLKNCMRSMEKNDFFQIDELLKSKLAQDVLEDAHFAECRSIFTNLRAFADEQIDRYRIEFKEALLQLADAAGLPLEEVDIPRFQVLKGIEGVIDFTNRKTTINQVVLKSIDPRRIISAAIKLKRKLYDTVFEPQKFIDSLFECYEKILKETRQAARSTVPIRELYTEYVWSLQSKAFFQNMDKGKFKGYTTDQFAVDVWRFFESEISSTEGGHLIRLSSGRGPSIWMIDSSGEKRQITHAAFVNA